MLNFEPNMQVKMKKLLSILAVSAVCTLTYGQESAKKVIKPTPIPSAEAATSSGSFKWNELVHDFGKIPKGTPVSTEFKFTNKGKMPITLSNVQASCGCTTPEWTKDPVTPGKNGTIKATFNAASPGAFNKTVTVTSNVEGGPVMLTIKGEVVE